MDEERITGSALQDEVLRGQAMKTRQRAQRRSRPDVYVRPQGCLDRREHAGMLCKLGTMSLAQRLRQRSLPAWAETRKRLRRASAR
jgi:hypothetical protein